MQRYLLQSILVCFFCASASASAQTHTRLYGSVLASDDPAAFMGGSSIGGGLWTSDDHGKNWTHLGWQHTKGYSVATEDTSNGNSIFSACGNGVIGSRDGGITWRMLTDWRISEVLDIYVYGQQKITIATASGFYRSLDSGEHWSAMNDGIPEPRYCARLFYYKKQQTLLAASSHGLYVYNEKEKNWRYDKRFSQSIKDIDTLTDGSLLVLTENGALYRDGKIIVRPFAKRGQLWCLAHSDTTIFIGGERGVFRYGGNLVLTLQSQSPKNVRSMLCTEAKLFVASLSGGVYSGSIDDEEVEFTLLGLEKLQVWSLRSSVID